MQNIIVQLRDQGLSDAEIIAALDDAKRELDLISGPDFLKELQAIRPTYTRTTIYKLAARHPEAGIIKSGDILYFPRPWAEAYLSKVRQRPRHRTGA